MPPRHIHISQNKQDHLTAAKALSAHLSLLGHPANRDECLVFHLSPYVRPDISCAIHDIDVLIQGGGDILNLRERLMDLDPQFVDIGYKLYYITQKPDGEMVREELLLNSPNNVHVETLSAGSLGLPIAIASTYSTGEAEIDILHPGILILTKFKRWSIQHTSTRPKTMRKNASDRSDIQFIIEWLAENGERIRFDEYEGKSKPELLAMVRKYRDKYADDDEHMAKLRSIMPDDWDAMLALPEPDPESALPP
ncbi:hypothetical protein BN946_scf184701.g5 [Trametes cinnabarina]|uniref:Uncharacterized protein n=1 Tax=Pycnoporus cinnabarinus TaxID=5643 RepID=A0A060SUI6_PYCCI|nr:hypothetical protein BN946_scf184701.g5 [Trametes cinnabarina]